MFILYPFVSYLPLLGSQISTYEFYRTTIQDFKFWLGIEFKYVLEGNKRKNVLVDKNRLFSSRLNLCHINFLYEKIKKVYNIQLIYCTNDYFDSVQKKEQKVIRTYLLIGSILSFS